MINGWQLWVLFGLMLLGLIPIVRALRRAEEHPGWRTTLRGVLVFVGVMAVIATVAVIFASTGGQ